MGAGFSDKLKLLALVEEHLNVELVNGETMGASAETTILSGDDLYQALTSQAYWHVGPYVSRGFVIDMYELEDVDFDQFYWNRDSIEQLSIDDKAYVAVGDICWSMIHMIYTNKDLMDTAGVAMPYDKVRNGQWIFDELVKLTANLYQDNGNGVRDNEDVYGFAGGWNDWGAVLPQAGNIFVAKKSDDGDFDLALYSDRTVDFYEKVYTWTQDEST